MKTFNKVVVMFFIMMFGMVGVSFAGTAPKFTPSIPSGSIVEEGDRLTFLIQVTAEDAAIDSCTYSWNHTDTKSIFDAEGLEGQEGLCGEITFEFETFTGIPGVKILQIEATDDLGNSTGIKEYKYIVEDTKAPTITSSVANKSTVEAGSYVTMVIEDDYALEEITYSWNDGEEKTLTLSDDFYTKYECKLGTFPKVNDTFKLEITAKDTAGNTTTRTYTYNVKYDDPTAPSVSMSEEDGSVLEGGTELTLTVIDNESKVTTLKYNWQGSSVKDIIPSQKEPANECEVTKIKIGTAAGTYKFNVTAVNSVGKETTKTYTYIVEAEEIPDTTLPTIEANPSSGNIAPKAAIALIAKDNEALATLKYNWDTDAVTTKTISGTLATVSVAAPSTAGKHTLHVTVIDAAGNSAKDDFEYTVVIADNQAPTIEANPSSGNIAPKATITLTAKDNEELATLKYNWDTDSVTTRTILWKITTLDVTAPSTTGKHTLHVTVIDAAGNSAKGDFTYTVVIADNQAPTIGANPSSGNIEPKATITLTAKDNEALATLKYNWDTDTVATKTISGTSATVSVVAPSTAGKHTLHVTVVDALGNSAKGDFTYTIVIKDEEAPTVTVTPNGGNVDAGDPAKITGKDNEGLDNITYYWDNEDPKKENVSGKEATVTTEIPLEPGKHTLHVTVEDESGNKVTDSFDFMVSDDEAPTITMNPKSGSTVKGGKVVKATLKDNVELKKVTYSWDDDDDTTKNISGTSKTIDLPALPYKEGTYKVSITVEDTAGNKTSGKYVYYVEDDDDDDEYPTVDADPDGGDVEYGDKITITAEDEDGEIEYVEYYWDDDDDDTTKKYKDEFTVKVPSEEGKHYLYVRAMDDDDNLCDYERFTYNVEENNYPGNSDIIGEINSRVKALRVEIRNADDKIRFEPEEEILYYVDYYNGTSSDAKNVKLVVDLPTYLEGVKASDNGKVSTKQVTWDIGTLKAGAYGRVSFVAKYTSSKANEKIITVPAKIYSGSSLRDTSTVRNMIFCVGASGTGNHQAYCIGYPDGSFRPEGKITRAELAAMVANIEGITATYRGQFTDANNHWAANYMQAVVDRGYMKAKGYNTFGAQDYATRADLAYAIAVILDVEDLEPIFISSTDTKNSEVRCAMEQLLRLGIMDGYSDGSAKPNSNITRAEAVTILNNYLFRGELYTKNYNYSFNYETSYNYGGNYYILRFTDLASNHWAYGHIMEATNNHKYERIMDGNEEMI